MGSCTISKECLDTTPFSYTLSLINGKYKMTILYTLMRFGVVRFNEMKKYIGGISYKTLSATLKELEADQLIHREEYPQIPPKVEYSLTERGASLIPVLDAMCCWGEKHRLNGPRLSAYELRPIRPEEGEQAAQIEQICFPPNEACSRDRMLRRAAAAPELFLVAADQRTGKLAGFLNGLSTRETAFRDAFFTDETLYDPQGENVMLLGLDVLPEHRGQGLARELVRRYAQEARRLGKSRLVLTCLEEKVGMYEKFGFRDLGMADSAWGGEQWHEMDMAL